MKWIYFRRELTAPIKIPAGSLRRMEDNEYQLLAANAPDDAIFDLTPKPMADALRQIGIGSVRPPMPASTAIMTSCPDCTAMHSGQLIVTRPHTHCFTCGGARAVVVPCPYFINRPEPRGMPT